MSASLLKPEPLPPDLAEAALARQASDALSDLYAHDTHISIGAIATDDSRTVALPASATRLLIDVLNQIADGHAVRIVPVAAELTTQQAAELLHVSRPFLIGLLERGDMPFHKVGTHRRVRYSDLMAYQQRELEARHQVLDELAQQAQELGMGY